MKKLISKFCNLNIFSYHSMNFGGRGGGGDDGKSSIIFVEEWLYKNHPFFECLGSIDELSSHIGLAIEYLIDKKGEVGKFTFPLEDIQEDLVKSGTFISSKGDKLSFNPHFLTLLLEKRIEVYGDGLPLLKGFVVPRGDKALAQLHVCRNSCRKVERNIVDLYLGEDLEREFNDIQTYFNRLSEFLFVFTRFYCMKGDVKEILV